MVLTAVLHKAVYDAGDRPAFRGLIEIMSAETTIITAIHNIKSNHGSETPAYFLRFKHFEAREIRRKYIDKLGKAEKRPFTKWTCPTGRSLSTST